MSSVKARAEKGRQRLWRSLAVAMAASAMAMARPAEAELLVSQLIVEFKPGSPKASDVEVANDSPERVYVSVEPREVLNPGTPLEKNFITPDPAKLGLLVSPSRFILEPRQRRTLRVAAIGAPSENERVYRVTVKPVTGELESSESGLKLLVGYDLLVLARPAVVRQDVMVGRSGKQLTLTNLGNASVELAEGKQCDDKGGTCLPLPGKRLYAGASWTLTLARAMGGEYQVRSAGGWSSLKF